MLQYAWHMAAPKLRDITFISPSFDLYARHPSKESVFRYFPYSLQVMDSIKWATAVCESSHSIIHTHLDSWCYMTILVDVT
jgi:hypothetical protein